MAHLGDCRALLDRDGDRTWLWSRARRPSEDAGTGPFAGGLAQLTADHVASDAAEAARVLRDGGRLELLADGKPRVARQGDLPGAVQITRSRCGTVSAMRADAAAMLASSTPPPPSPAPTAAPSFSPSPPPPASA